MSQYLEQGIGAKSDVNGKEQVRPENLRLDIPCSTVHPKVGICLGREPG